MLTGRFSSLGKCMRHLGVGWSRVGEPGCAVCDRRGTGREKAPFFFLGVFRSWGGQSIQGESPGWDAGGGEGGSD